MRRITSQDLLSMKWVSDPQISPDGSKVLFAVKSVVDDEKEKRYRTQIYIACDGQVRQFTSGPRNDTSPRWSPDGTRVAFLSDRGKDKTQIFVMSMSGGEAVQVTFGKEGVSDPVWSPCGKKIAFVALEDEPEPKDVPGQEKSDVRVITRLRYKLNGRGFLPERRSQIFVLDLETGKVTQLTFGPYDCREPEWSPDGKFIAFTSARFEDCDLTSVRDIYVIPASGGEMRKLTSSDAVLSAPSWSPDGRFIACYGHDNSMRGATVTGICVVSAEGGPVTYLTRAHEIEVAQTPGTDMVSSPAGRPGWSQDGRHVYFTALWHGRTHLYSVDISDGTLAQITVGDSAVFGWSKAAGCNRFAICVTAPQLIGDVFVLDRSDDPMWDAFRGDPGCSIDARPPFRVVRLTQVNRELLSSVYLSLPEEHWVIAKDGTRIQTWVMKPVGMKENVRYPVALEIHGGPHSAYGYAFFHEFQLLCARGYGVIFSNPRGSTGYGQQFVAAIKHDWGGVDYEDLMSVTDFAETLPWVDRERMGVLGGSYGGYMTNWIVTRTNRFKAAVTMRSTCNRLSQFGASDAAYTNGDFEFDGDPWDNPKAYLDRSPLMYVRNVQTPVLIIHSEQDLRCPMEQAEEWFVALKKLKKTVVFVRFPDENHELSRSGKPRHRIERLEYILAWFDRYLSPVADDYSPALERPEKPPVKLP